MSPPARRIGLLVVALAVAAVCVRLGIWQLDRLDQRRAMNASITAGLAAAPVDLAELLPADDPDDLAYRRVTVTGTYDRAHELLLYGRALEGRPGDHVLTPLVLSDGERVLVDRGWVPARPDAAAPVGPPASAPAGMVQVEGVLLPSEEGAAFANDTSTTLVRAVNVEQIDAATTGEGLAPAYLLLQGQTPAQAEDTPIPAPLPETTEGPHLSYAIQWFSFAAIALIGYVVLDRRGRDERRGADAQGGG